MRIYPIIFIYLLDYFVKKPSQTVFAIIFILFIYCYFIVLFRQSFCYFSDIWDDNNTTGGMNHTIIIFLHFILHNVTLLKGRICVCVFVLSCVQLFVTSRTVAHQARLLHPQNSPARILEWVAISFSRGCSCIRDQTHLSYIGSQILYH